MKHICRKNGRKVGALDGQNWCRPGEIVKLADQENWGRTVMWWRCCDSYDVEVAETGEQEAGILRALPESALESPWVAYPTQLPPEDYPIPGRKAGLVRVGGLPKDA